MTLSLVEGDSIHESLNGLLDRLVATFNEDEFYQLTQGLSMEEKSAFIQSYIFENLNEQGIPFEVMLPLIDETAGKVHELSPTQAQTGPAVRYDENVISKHLEMLADEESLQELYEKISKSIHNLPLSVIQANKEGKNS